MSQKIAENRLPNNGKRPPKNSRSPPTCKWLHISKLPYVPYDSVKTAPSYVEALPHSETRNRTYRKKSPKIELQTTVNGLPKILRGLPTCKWLHISKLLYVPYNPVKTAPSISKRCLTVKAETGHVAKNRRKSSSKQR